MSGTCPQAFVQCPVYEWMKPDAYNYELSKEKRARVLDDWEAGDMGRHRGDLGRYGSTTWRRGPLRSAASTTRGGTPEGMP